MNRILDAIDRFFGYDRRAVRAMMVILAVPILLIGIERGHKELTSDGCDARCQYEAERFIQEVAPELLPPIGTPEPFNPDRFIDKVLNE